MGISREGDKMGRMASLGCISSVELGNLRKGVQEFKILALEQGHVMVCVVSTQQRCSFLGRRDRNYRNNTVIAAYVFHAAIS
jgi:hypothetical protein